MEQRRVIQPLLILLIAFHLAILRITKQAIQLQTPRIHSLHQTPPTIIVALAIAQTVVVRVIVQAVISPQIIQVILPQIVSRTLQLRIQPTLLPINLRTTHPQTPQQQHRIQHRILHQMPLIAAALVMKLNRTLQILPHQTQHPQIQQIIALLKTAPPATLLLIKRQTPLRQTRLPPQTLQTQLTQILQPQIAQRMVTQVSQIPQLIQQTVVATVIKPPRKLIMKPRVIVVRATTQAPILVHHRVMTPIRVVVVVVVIARIRHQLQIIPLQIVLISHPLRMRQKVMTPKAIVITQ
jgi:hypothetical protein